MNSAVASLNENICALVKPQHEPSSKTSPLFFGSRHCSDTMGQYMSQNISPKPVITRQFVDQIPRREVLQNNSRKTLLTVIKNFKFKRMACVSTAGGLLLATLCDISRRTSRTCRSAAGSLIYKCWAIRFQACF